MTKKKKSKILKWDEVNGVDKTEEDLEENVIEEPGAGPSISRNPMRGIEDMVEQNDNQFDGIINNVPNFHAADSNEEELVKEKELEEKKKSIRDKIQEGGTDFKQKPSKNLYPEREYCYE